ncbi:MAG: hypothetical protein Q7R85_02910 [bacterium]|nr:hypothetical protein [bacterium]
MSVELCDSASLDEVEAAVEGFLKSPEGVVALEKIRVAGSCLTINNLRTHADVLCEGGFCMDVPYFGMHCFGSGRPLKTIIADWAAKVRRPASVFLPALKAGLDKIGKASGK